MFEAIIQNFKAVMVFDAALSIAGKLFKAGVHIIVKAVFTPLKIGLMAISRSRFKQYKNPMFISQINVLGFFL